MLKNTLDQDELLRYTRHLPVIGMEGQLRLKNAKVLCVGAGGLGCPALQYLAASGVGTLGVMDADHVELSNLQRQILFSEKDVGRNKAVVIGERLSALNSKISFEIHQSFISEINAKSIISNYDIVLDASDNYPTRYLLNSTCRSLGVPLVSASILQFEAQLSVFNFNNGPCYQCLYPTPPAENSSPNCNLSGVLGVLPGVAGCLQAAEAIKIILDKGEVLSGTLLSINLLSMHFKQFKILKQDCSSHPTIHFDKTRGKCQSSLAPIRELKAVDLAELIASNPDDIQLLDVRETFEREICHIGGVHIPLTLLTTELIERTLRRDKPIIVYCRSGIRSRNACQELIDLGFEDVSNLSDGIIGWIKTVDTSLRSY